MAQRAVLLGIKESPKGDSVTLIESGDPREIRKRFKFSDGEGFDKLEVFESAVGRSRWKRFGKGQAPAAPVVPAPIEDEEEIDIEALKVLASGDKRRAETREAIAKLDALGV